MGLRGINAQHIRKMAPDVAAIVRAPQPWDKAGLSRAEKVAVFLETLPVTSGSLRGTKFKVRDWQWKEIIEPIYRTDDTGRRYVREAIISLPRKNGKTGIVAGLAACHLVGPEAVERGQVYSAANAKKQAGLIFNELSAIVSRMQWMKERVNVQRFLKRMEDIGGNESTYEALAAEVWTEHGLSTSFWIYDELGQAKSRDLYDVLSTSGGAWEEPLGLIISTQAATSMHIMSELVDDVIQIRDGIVEDKSRYGVVYCAPDDADPWSQETWAACNPALGDFRSLTDMQDFAKKAMRMPSSEATFRNLYLNQRVSKDVKFLPPAIWDLCGEDEVTFNREGLKGRECIGALDLSGTGKNDLTALVLLFDIGDGVQKALPFFWAAEDALEEAEARDRVPYRLWAKRGHLLTNPGALLDYSFLASTVATLTKTYTINLLAVDPWNFDRFKIEADNIGVNLDVVTHGQAIRDMTGPVRELENFVLGGKLRHNRNPILTWCMNNVMILSDSSGNRKFDKRKSSGRIDGAVALVMAAGLATQHPRQPEYQMLVVG